MNRATPRLPFDGGLCRRHDLLPMATSARFFSSASPESTDKNLSPPCTEPSVSVEDKSNKKLPAYELQRQIVHKQGELLQLLLQMHGGPSPSSSDSEKCLKEEEQLIHLLQEFQAKTQCKESPEFDAAVRFLVRGTFFLIFVTFIVLVTT